jgi:hypothetical protein
VEDALVAGCGDVDAGLSAFAGVGLALVAQHAERNFALIRQLEAETRQWLDHLPRLDAERST